MEGFDRRFRQDGSPATRAMVRKSKRGLNRTCRCAWLDGRWPEEAGPRRRMAGGGITAAKGRDGLVWELRESEVELGVGSARAERPWRSGVTVSSSSPAFGLAVAAFWRFGAGKWREREGIGTRGFPWC